LEIKARLEDPDTRITRIYEGTIQVRLIAPPRAGSQCCNRAPRCAFQAALAWALKKLIDSFELCRSVVYD
jgi:hypothetical protein